MADSEGLIFIVILVGVLGFAALIGNWYANWQKTAWEEFAQRHGLVCQVNRFLGLITSIRVSGVYRGYTITLGTFTRSYGRSSVTYTYLEAPLQSSSTLDLRIAARGMVSTVRRWLGFKDIAIGDPEVDGRFYFRCADEALCIRLFASIDLRQRLLALRKFDELELRYQKVKIQQRGVERNGEYLTQLMEFVTAMARSYDELKK
jgi:hypothetical protein